MEIVSKVDRVDRGAGPLVERGLLSDPEVDVPIKRPGRIHERVQHDVAVALVELPVADFVNLKKLFHVSTILDF